MYTLWNSTRLEPKPLILYQNISTGTLEGIPLQFGNYHALLLIYREVGSPKEDKKVTKILFVGNFTFGALKKCIKNFLEVTILKKEWKKMKCSKRDPSASRKTSGSDFEESLKSKIADTDIEQEMSIKEESVILQCVHLIMGPLKQYFGH